MILSTIYYNIHKITCKKFKFLKETHLFELLPKKYQGFIMTAVYQLSWVRGICLLFAGRKHNILGKGRDKANQV